MSCTGLEGTLNEIITNVNCIERNFDSHSRGEALGRFRKNLLGIDEEFMRLLEQLDGLELQVIYVCVCVYVCMSQGNN